MFSERPSQQHVVGVSRRYLDALDYSLALEEYKEVFITRQLLQFQAMRVGGTMAYLAVAKLVKAPIQSMRQSYLAHAQEVEGFVPGEEAISTFAQRKLYEYTQLPSK